jgi:hypothetical protein
LYFFVWNKSGPITNGDSHVDSDDVFSTLPKYADDALNELLSGLNIDPESLSKAFVLSKITTSTDTDTALTEFQTVPGTYVENSFNAYGYEIWNGIILKTWTLYNADGSIRRYLILFQNENKSLQWVITDTTFNEPKFMSSEIAESISLNLDVTSQTWTHSVDNDETQYIISFQDITQNEISTTFTVTDSTFSSKAGDFTGTYTPYDGSREEWNWNTTTVNYVLQSWSSTDPESGSTVYASYYYYYDGTPYFVFQNSSGKRKLYGIAPTSGIITEFSNSWFSDSKGTKDESTLVF